MDLHGQVSESLFVPVTHIRAPVTNLNIREILFTSFVKLELGVYHFSPPATGAKLPDVNSMKELVQMT